jgi:hypothetical protein
LLLDGRALTPFGIAVLSNLGYAAFYALMAGGSLSVWPAAVGLYTICPVVYGICARGERASLRKLLGVGLALSAVTLLGFSGAGAGSAAGSGGGTAAVLFVLVFVLWGMCDIASAEVRADFRTILVATLAGQCCVAAAAGLAAYVHATDALAAAAAAGGGPPGAAPFGMRQLALMAGNAVALLGWCGYVYLGQRASLSTFAPLISLAAFTPAVVGVAALGEPLTPLKAAGLAVGVAAALVIATADVGAAALPPTAAAAAAAAEAAQDAGAQSGAGAVPQPPPPQPLPPTPTLQLPLLPPAAAAAIAVVLSPCGWEQSDADVWRATGAAHGT